MISDLRFVISERILSSSFRIFFIKQPKKYTLKPCAFRPRFDWKRTMMMQNQNVKMGTQ